MLSFSILIETILVAERDEPTIEVLIKALRAGGFAPWVAHETQSALAGVEREGTRLAIVGEGLGTTESARLSRALRARFPGLRILLLAPPGSLRPFTTSELEAFESDEILPRPLDPERVLARVRAHLDATKDSGKPTPVRGEHIEIDPGLVETAARAAALEALEEAHARQDREWARVRAEETSRDQGRRVAPGRAPSGPRLPQPSLSGRLGGMSDRLQLLLWLGRRKVTGRLQASGLSIDLVLGDLKTTGATLERLLAGDDSAWSFEESSETGERSKTSIAPELVGALVRLGQDPLAETHGRYRARLLVPAIELGPETARVLAYFDGARTREQVAEQAGVSAVFVGAAAAVAYAAGILGVTASALGASSRERRVALDLALSRFSTLLDADDPFAALGVPSGASGREVEAAYLEAVSALELDQPRDTPVAEALRLSVRSRLEEARAMLAVPGLRRALRPGD